MRRSRDVGTAGADVVIDCGVPPAPPVALTIAGSDPSGGAGLQADLKTFHRFGAFGLAVPTLVTVQNTCGLRESHSLGPRLVLAQLECVQEDIPAAAAKTGALGEAGTVEAVADWVRDREIPLVVDPVILSTHGHRLASESAVDSIRERLLPVCRLVTPNLAEAAALSGAAVDSLRGMGRAAERIGHLGAPNVLVKGGHLDGEPIDLLWADGEILTYSAVRVDTAGTHGTGCTYSAAITALLALGEALPDAIATAKRFVTEAIRTAPRLGRGNRPLNHHARARGSSLKTLGAPEAGLHA